MAITTITYTSTFPPPISKHLKLSASTLSWPQAYIPSPDTFDHFSLLPYELQHQIWAEAAKQWIEEYLERINTWTVGEREKNTDINTSENSNDSSSKRVFLIHITSNPAYRRQSPNLLWACATSRAVLFSALLGWNSNSRVQQGPGIHLFLRRCVTPLMGLGKPAIFGCRIQDFRYAGLASRVREEERRIGQMGKELGQVIAGEVVDAERAERKVRRGYVRLPLLNGLGMVFRKDFESGEWRVQELYPVVDMDGP